MRKIILDTNIYIAFKRSRKEVVEILQHVDYIGINSIVLGELLAGFKGGNREPKIGRNWMSSWIPPGWNL